MDKKQAQAFAEQWVESWNQHDLDKILSHYEDDFVMISPVIAQLFGEPSGVLQGKEAVGRYWAAALQEYPQLKFKVKEVLLGMGSITILYQGVTGMAAEVFHFADSGKVERAYAHYGV